MSSFEQIEAEEVGEVRSVRMHWAAVKDTSSKSNNFRVSISQHLSTVSIDNLVEVEVVKTSTHAKRLLFIFFVDIFPVRPLHSHVIR